jgi:hypothetical protein
VRFQLPGPVFPPRCLPFLLRRLAAGDDNAIEILPDPTTIRIDRPTLDVADASGVHDHPSEGNLSDWRFDLHLTNNHDAPARWASHGTTSIRALTSNRRAYSLACGHEPYDLN